MPGRILLYPGAGIDLTPLQIGFWRQYSQDIEKKDSRWQDNSLQLCRAGLLNDIQTYVFLDVFGHKTETDIAWFDTVEDFMTYLRLRLTALRFDVRVADKKKDMIHFEIRNSDKPVHFYYFFGIDFADANPSSELRKLYSKVNVLYQKGFWIDPEEDKIEFNLKTAKMFKNIDMIICQEYSLNEQVFHENCPKLIIIFHTYTDFDHRSIYCESSSSSSSSDEEINEVIELPKDTGSVNSVNAKL